MPTAKIKRNAAKPEGDLLPIRAVAALTGVSALTLRAWERRHGFVKPIRTESGHRLYRPEDIETIRRAVALVDKGVSISQVPHSLANERDSSQSTPSHWVAYRKRMIASIGNFDEYSLDDIYNEALAVHSIEQVTQQVLMPLLQDLGARWENKDGSVAEEHFFGVYLRNKLGARFHHRPRVQGPRFLGACLPREHHESGLLLFALSASDLGLQPVLLGADMPLAELPLAAKRGKCSAIVLSGSINPDDSLFADELPKLVTSAAVPVFVGGSTSVRHATRIVAAGAIPVGIELIQGAERIRSALSVVKAT